MIKDPTPSSTAASSPSPVVRTRQQLTNYLHSPPSSPSSSSRQQNVDVWARLEEEEEREFLQEATTVATIESYLQMNYGPRASSSVAGAPTSLDGSYHADQDAAGVDEDSCSTSSVLESPSCKRDSCINSPATRAAPAASSSSRSGAGGSGPLPFTSSTQTRPDQLQSGAEMTHHRRNLQMKQSLKIQDPAGVQARPNAPQREHTGSSLQRRKAARVGEQPAAVTQMAAAQDLNITSNRTSSTTAGGTAEQQLLAPDHPPGSSCTYGKNASVVPPASAFVHSGGPVVLPSAGGPAGQEHLRLLTDTKSTAKSCKLSTANHPMITHFNEESAPDLGFDFDFDNITEKQLSNLTERIKQHPEELLPLKFVQTLIYKVHQLYKQQYRQPLVFLEPPKKGRMVIVGDTHGQLEDLLWIFFKYGRPSSTNVYFFNGDMVDRGMFGTEILLLMYAHQLFDRHSVHVNRGNHEDANMNERDRAIGGGFAQECRKKYGNDVFQLIQKTFNLMPLATIVSEKLLIIHGGLFRCPNVTLKQLNKVERVRTCPEHPQTVMDWIFFDSLWADPNPTKSKGISKRGDDCFSFGSETTKKFLKENHLHMVVRSHELPANSRGFQVHHDSKLITIFSASNYCGTSGNYGAVMLLQPSLEFEIFEHWAPNLREILDLEQENIQACRKILHTLEDLTRKEENYKSVMRQQSVCNLENEIITKLKVKICEKKEQLKFWWSSLGGTSDLIGMADFVEGLSSCVGENVPWQNLIEKHLDLPTVVVPRNKNNNFAEDVGPQAVEAAAEAVAPPPVVSNIKVVNWRTFLHRFRVELDNVNNVTWIRDAIVTLFTAIWKANLPLRQLFALFDLNLSGSVTVDSFKAVVCGFELGFSDSECLELYACIATLHHHAFKNPMDFHTSAGGANVNKGRGDAKQEHVSAATGSSSSSSSGEDQEKNHHTTGKPSTSGGNKRDDVTSEKEAGQDDVVTGTAKAHGGASAAATCSTTTSILQFLSNFEFAFHHVSSVQQGGHEQEIGRQHLFRSPCCSQPADSSSVLLGRSVDHEERHYINPQRDHEEGGPALQLLCILYRNLSAEVERERLEQEQLHLCQNGNNVLNSVSNPGNPNPTSSAQKMLTNTTSSPPITAHYNQRSSLQLDADFANEVQTKLLHLFEHADADQDGFLNEEEMKVFLDRASVLSEMIPAWKLQDDSLTKLAVGFIDEVVTHTGIFFEQATTSLQSGASSYFLPINMPDRKLSFCALLHAFNSVFRSNMRRVDQQGQQQQRNVEVVSSRVDNGPPRDEDTNRSGTTMAMASCSPPPIIPTLDGDPQLDAIALLLYHNRRALRKALQHFDPNSTYLVEPKHFKYALQGLKIATENRSNKFKSCTSAGCSSGSSFSPSSGERITFWKTVGEIDDFVARLVPPCSLSAADRMRNVEQTAFINYDAVLDSFTVVDMHCTTTASSTPGSSSSTQTTTGLLVPPPTMSSGAGSGARAQVTAHDGPYATSTPEGGNSNFTSTSSRVSWGKSSRTPDTIAASSSSSAGAMIAHEGDDNCSHHVVTGSDSDPSQLHHGTSKRGYTTNRISTFISPHSQHPHGRSVAANSYSRTWRKRCSTLGFVQPSHPPHTTGITRAHNRRNGAPAAAPGSFASLTPDSTSHPGAEYRCAQELQDETTSNHCENGAKELQEAQGDQPGPSPSSRLRDYTLDAVSATSNTTSEHTRSESDRVLRHERRCKTGEEVPSGRAAACVEGHDQDFSSPGKNHASATRPSASSEEVSTGQSLEDPPSSSTPPPVDIAVAARKSVSEVLQQLVVVPPSGGHGQGHPVERLFSFPAGHQREIITGVEIKDRERRDRRELFPSRPHQEQHEVDHQLKTEASAGCSVHLPAKQLQRPKERTPDHRRHQVLQASSEGKNSPAKDPTSHGSRRSPPPAARGDKNTNGGSSCTQERAVSTSSEERRASSSVLKRPSTGEKSYDSRATFSNTSSSPSPKLENLCGTARTPTPNRNRTSSGLLDQPPASTSAGQHVRGASPSSPAAAHFVEQDEQEEEKLLSPRSYALQKKFLRTGVNCNTNDLARNL
ncbi:unnamed protein product [Amoebophrya sp. A120]|nr:unnamed protein product [Amoebophrya sp. A120]|eukprot:GSA120T00021809001.1